MGKTTNPKELVDLGKLWVKNGGVNLGIKGDLDHVEQGVSYHLGKAELKPNAPSATSARDKAGLTNAASAMARRCNGTTVPPPPPLSRASAPSA